MGGARRRRAGDGLVMKLVILVGGMVVEMRWYGTLLSESR